MDGNGRWAKKINLTRKDGHKAGIKACINLINNLNKLDCNIHEISFYVFSSENWNRPLSEINDLFSLIETYYLEFENIAHNNNIRINHFGSRKKLNRKILKIIDDVIKRTKKNNGQKLNLVFNYGSRDEIVHAINKLGKKKANKKNISKNLYSKFSNDPDLIIRTGGEVRLSNFMLWQSAYSELYFTKKLWPDFKISDLKRILINYHNRKRNFGKIND